MFSIHSSRRSKKQGGGDWFSLKISFLIHIWQGGSILSCEKKVEKTAIEMDYNCYSGTRHSLALYNTKKGTITLSHMLL